MLRRRGTSLSGFHEQFSRSSTYVPPPTQPRIVIPQHPSASYHTSTFRTKQYEVQIYSPSAMDVSSQGGLPVALPVFGASDYVTGRVVLSNRPQGGRLSVSIEGAFMFNPPCTEDDMLNGVPLPATRKHVFFSSTNHIPISPVSENFPRSAFREAFSTMKKRPSQTSLSQLAQGQSQAEWSHYFSFELPQGARSLEEIPHTFKSAAYSSCEQNRQGSYAIEYQIRVALEQPGGSDSCLDVPFVFHADSDFQSLDGHNEQENWLEMPLKADRPMPFKCAVTLPTSGVFSRTSSVPYFVVFSTTPRSHTLSLEIASDATIAVSVLRQITVLESITFPPTPPLTPSASSEESDPPPSAISRFKRVVKSPSQTLISRGFVNPEEGFELREKPLPRLPGTTVYSDSCNLHTAMCIGFPKRPRLQCDDQGHPSLDVHAALPDGLHKSKILLNRDMLPSIDWAGLSVKYYLDVSVLVGHHDLRARIPIRVI